MQGISTITQKGQATIPKVIRDHFNLQTSGKIRFFVRGNAILVEPVTDVAAMRGVVQHASSNVRINQKNIIKNRVVKKHANRS